MVAASENAPNSHPDTLTMAQGELLLGLDPKLGGGEGIENSERFALKPGRPSRGTENGRGGGTPPVFQCVANLRAFLLAFFFFFGNTLPPFSLPHPALAPGLQVYTKKKKKKETRAHSDTHQWRQGRVGKTQERSRRQRGGSNGSGSRQVPRKSPSGPTSPRRPRQGSEEPGEQMEEWSSL